MRYWSRGFLSLLVAITLGAAMGISSSEAQPHPDSLLKDLEWRNIGPANMMGRISSVDALHDDYRTVLIGASAGGVWKSTNAGNTVTPIFDEYGSQSVGDAKFFQPDPSIIWVGTGEDTNRNSVGWGDGVYKSTDGGETFENMGLRDTYQIAEVQPHPTDSSIVYVAALGNLWSYKGRRGLFKSTDGGETWEKLTNGLPDDKKTGATAIEINPENPDEIYVGMYQRLRRPWAMKSGGSSGGLYKSTDGGESWTKLTNGLPEGNTGQIDVDIYRENPDVVMAYVEADDDLPHDMSVPGAGIYRSNDGGQSWTYQLRHNSRPSYHGRVRINPSNDSLIYVVSRDFRYSTDGGKTYEEGKPFSSDGGDDHDLWISPKHPEIMYQATDQGAFLNLNSDAHVGLMNMAIGQYYEVGVDMRDPYWVYGGHQDNGAWGIPSQTRSWTGIRVDDAVEVSGGDGFEVLADPTNWRNVYVTAHVGMFGRLDMKTREHTPITPTPQTTVNFDEYYRPNFNEYPTEYTINPGERWIWPDIHSRTINGSNLPPQFRWNWNSPLAMSPKNPRTIYVGSNHLFKSVDRGETWRIVSPDLTQNNPKTRNSTMSGGLTRDATGAENYHTIYSIDESPLNSEVIWAGTDDGNVQVTRDGGDTWTNVRLNIPGLPDTVWVSEVNASHHDAGTAYVTFDNHRMGDFDPYVYKTTDFGDTWTDLSEDIPSDLPGNSIHTLAEDPNNPNLLFIGTEFGCYVSIDGGSTWTRLMNNLPPVAVRDLVIHPREQDLVAGTHGRSIWILDDISPLQQLSESIMKKEVHFFDQMRATKWLNRTDYSKRTSLKFNGENPPSGAAINFYLRSQPQDSVEVTVRDSFSGRERTWEMRAHEGINRTYWDLEFGPPEREREALPQQMETALTEARNGVQNSEYTKALQVMAQDVLAAHRAPDQYEEVEYPPMDSYREVLLAHLDGVERELEEASSAEELNDVRSQLLRFSPVVGDKAFLGFYDEPITVTEAAPGTYRVEVRVGDRTVTGPLRLRKDLMLDD
jgi:photosystem II stability/assembly factor-like uncharacterized protein